MEQIQSHPELDGWALDQILEGSARTVLGQLPDQCVDCIVTSPPYFGQRDYEHDDQLGRERDPDLYVQRLVEVFALCRRVLKETGTLWLNLGDKYRDGQLLGMPWRVALALKEDGWNLRSDIIWHKPNAMPHSVKTRPTTDHEYIFLFSPGKKVCPVDPDCISTRVIDIRNVEGNATFVLIVLRDSWLIDQESPEYYSYQGQDACVHDQPSP